MNTLYIIFQVVDLISTRYDQQLKLAHNCHKFEREEDDLIEARISCSIGNFNSDIWFLEILRNYFYQSIQYIIITYVDIMLAGLTDDEKSYLRRIERKLDQDQKYKECMRNLDPIFRKQNRALVDVSALKRLPSRYSCFYFIIRISF